MGKVRGFTIAARQVAAEPWCALSLLFLSYMGLGAVDKYLLEGQPVTGSLLWLWETMLAFPQRPLVQLLMIPLALWMFGRGVAKIISRNDQAAMAVQREADTARERERSIWQAAKRLPVEIARCYAIRIDLDRLDSHLHRWKEQFAKESQRLKEFADADETYFTDQQGVPFERSSQYNDLSIQTITAFPILPWQPDWKRGALVTNYAGPMSSTKIFVKANNGQFLDAASHNQSLIKRRISTLETVRDRTRADLIKREEEAWKAASQAPDLTAS